MSKKNFKEKAIKIDSNLKNVFQQTGSYEIFENTGSYITRSSFININKLPNTSKRYEYLNLSGRTENNKNLVHNINFQSISHSVSEEFSDTNTEDRIVNKNIFVNKFSSPGAESSAEISLNKESGEYSVYNTINYKNLLARNNLREWLSETSSIESVPSIHKINKNPKYSVNEEYVFNGEESITGSFIDVVDYDNYFVSHQIPQSDKQYSWIKNSLTKNNIFEPQYRDFENQKIFDGIKVYDIKKIDSSSLIALYLKNTKIYVGFLTITTEGRERTIDIISENYIPSVEFGSPTISILNNNNGIIKGIVASTWISDDLNEYPIFCPFKFENKIFSFGNIQKNTNIPFITKQHSYAINLSEIDFIVKRIQNDYFCMANSGTLFIGKVDDYLNITTSSQQSFIGENPNIFPINNNNFIFSYSSDEQKYQSVIYNTSSLSFDLNFDLQSFSPSLKHTKYSYLGKDTSDNSYYTLIYKNGNINVDLLKIDYNLTSSILQTISVGTPDTDNCFFIKNNSLETSLVDYSTNISEGNFKSIFLINNSSSGGVKLTTGIIDVDIQNETLLQKNTYELLQTSSYDIGLLPVISNDNKSVDTYFFYNKNSDTLFEHCSISKDQFFTYFVNRELFDNNLESLWKKELYKNFSIYNTKIPESEQEYYFSYKTSLLDPIVEFCGTNISILKDYNYETNTVSLLNLSQSLNLREYLTNLNGFYGFSSWRQINNSRNWINNNLKKQNKYFYKNSSYLEPVITKQYPLKINVTTEETFELEDDYLNQHTFLSNAEFSEIFENNKIYKYINKNSAYEEYVSLFKEAFNYISFTENLYPKKNFYAIKRKRDSYDEVNLENRNENINISNEFWKNDPLDRLKDVNNSYNNLNYINKNITNDLNYVKTKTIFPNIVKDTNLTKSWIGTNTKQGYSIWPMDNYFIYNNNSYNIFEYQSLFNGTSSINGITSSISSSYYDLELDSIRVIGDLSYPGYLEERKLTYFIPSNLFGIKSTPRTQFIFNPFNITENFEPFGMLFRTYDISKKQPWYNTYEEYVNDLKTVGQDYNIIPEYNISDNVKTYLENGSEYINKGFLSLKGEKVSSSVINNETINRFFTKDSNSDLENNIARDLINFNTSSKYNNLYSNNINLELDSNSTNVYNLPNNIIKNSSIDNFDLQNPTSIIFKNSGSESYLYSLITNINDSLSQSNNITCPNLTTSSFGISAWFKISKDAYLNKTPVGLFTLLNSQDPNLYEQLSLGLLLNTSGTNIGDGNISDTDIVLYNNGPHDSGIETKNIIKFYNNSSSIASTKEFPSSKILLDDNWHHIYVQYNKPTSYNSQYVFDQKQSEEFVFPEEDADYGYLKNTFRSIKTFKNSRKNILLRKEGQDYIIASVNIFGTNNDVSVMSDEKNIGINIYKLRGSKYTLLDTKIIPFRYDSYKLNDIRLNNDPINSFTVEDYTYLDVSYVGNYNSKDTFIITINYRGIQPKETFLNGYYWSIYTDYIFASFDDNLYCSEVKQLIKDDLIFDINQLKYISKVPTSFCIMPLEYTSSYSKYLLVNNNTYNEYDFKHLSTIREYEIDFSNEILNLNSVPVERFTINQIAHPVLSDKITSLKPVKTYLNNGYPS